jgi:hypothetical protein
MTLVDMLFCLGLYELYYLLACQWVFAAYINKSDLLHCDYLQFFFSID